MDDNKRRDIDLSSFDLSQFKEYFEEEDAQRAAEEKERKERAAKEEAERLAAQEEAVRLEIAEKREAAMKAEREAREKEEARRAAEKAAAAAMAAKRAEEARQKANLEASAKLREQAEAENTLSPESFPTKQKPDESEAQFKKFASILDIEDLKSNTEDDKDNEEDDEITGFLVDKDKTKSRLFTALCVVLCVAQGDCGRACCAALSRSHPLGKAGVQDRAELHAVLPHARGQWGQQHPSFEWAERNAPPLFRDRR